MMLRFHTQTAGVSLTAQQPDNNIVRTTIEALAGVMGGTQSLHTNAMDEVYALPTQHAAEVALRTQQVIAHETNIAHVADPLGGSYFVEALTDEVERQAEAYLGRILEMGSGSILDGVYAGIDSGFFQAEIADASFELECRFDSGRRLVVGVNTLASEGGPVLDILEIDPEVEVRQHKRLAETRAARSDAGVRDSLAALEAAAVDSSTNLMPSILDAVRAMATEGEIIDALAGVFGRYREIPVI
jgi:methylmalonyl-CoA mutase N-terminal domain/subunit